MLKSGVDAVGVTVRAVADPAEAGRSTRLAATTL